MTPYIGGGTTYKIYPHWTLATVFGPADQAGLKAGSSTTADQLTVVNANGAATYFYSSGGAVGVGWRKSGGGSTDYSNQPLYIDQGIAYSRNVTTNLTVQLVGAVKLGPTIIPLFGPGNSFQGNVYASSATTLTNSLLYTDGNQTDSFVAGSSTTADQVLLPDSVVPGQLDTYFYSSGGAIGKGWRMAGGGSADASQVQIPMGAGVLIVFKGSHPGFNWVPPVPYTP